MAKHTSPEVPIITDPLEAAKAAKLRYVSDSDAGITRERHGKGFTYLDARGKRISEAERERVEALVMYGFAPRRTAISLRPGAIRRGASSICITRAGVRSATRPSSTV
jgi:hypothetical protein